MLIVEGGSYFCSMHFIIVAFFHFYSSSSSSSPLLLLLAGGGIVISLTFLNDLFNMKLKNAHKIDRVLVHRANKIFNAGNFAITMSYFSVILLHSCGLYVY